MIKYIITWCIVYNVPTSCPDANRANEFGQTSMYTNCAVYHSRTEYDCDHTKTFNNRKDALGFYGRATEQGYSGFGSGVAKVKLDSITYE